MTKLYLLAILEHIPDDCEVLIYDPEVEMDAPITGSYYDPAANTVTLYTDED